MKTQLRSGHRSMKFGLLVMAVCFAPFGCGGSGKVVPAKLVAVTGVVTLDGEPLAGATANFVPTQSTAGKGGYGVTDSAGTFEATDYSGTPGLEPGVYNVTFSKIATADGSPIPEGQTAADVGASEVLPGHLTQVRGDMHPFVLNVKDAGDVVTYDLKSK